MSRAEQLERLVQLVAGQRWAALASVDEARQPKASMVAYRVCDEFDGVLLHLSRLAEHTRNLLAEPHASLVVSSCDNGSDDPQLLPRATLQGRVEIIERDDPRYLLYRDRYLEKLPESARLFEFPDFILFRLHIAEIRFVGGFGQAFTFRAQEWRNAQA
ncbi:MAG TPA: pyridoxamine 5'-phosphate oxidase family protein [Gammaproteobacteria bacterium]